MPADRRDFLEVLVRVASGVVQHRVLVLGDFNAKSLIWGNPATNARGREVEAWAVSSVLSLLNRGTVHTCVRQQGGSIVDLAFASPSLAACIVDWRVELVETLSDHRYVRFDVSIPGFQGAQEGRSHFPRWALSRLDREAATEAAFVQDWLSPPVVVRDVDATAAHLRVSLTEVCNSSMPLSHHPPPRRAVYWWSEELGDLRAACVAARRPYTRSRRRRLRDLDNEDRLYAAYIEAKSTLTAQMGTAQDRARAEMLEGLDMDPFGRPYKAARNKLRPYGPPVAETLEPSLLDGVVQSLFPRRMHSTRDERPARCGSIGRGGPAGYGGRGGEGSLLPQGEKDGPRSRRRSRKGGGHHRLPDGRKVSGPLQCVPDV
ncbi:uncharacterized protein LOC124635331 [Helicoverpa zea]|uniref:uncharacterized protein LOC124635331 n=1 Tax=Helicoverpa zea TaxID=7113 RepID=UPI001F59A44F|nr:uncharacterized protein LOC124635331 [Helicoverpa zea]